MKLGASNLIAGACLILSATSVAAAGDFCDRWSLHGFTIGMPADEALEVDLEGNPRANVAKVKRHSGRIAFKYRGGGGGAVWFGPDGTVARLRTSRSDGWDRPILPPSAIVSYSEQARLLWLDKRCDVGIAMTRFRTEVTTSSAFLARPKNRYDLSVGSLEAASRFGALTAGVSSPGGGPYESYPYCSWYFGGLWPRMGDPIEACRRLYWDWINYLESVSDYPRYESAAELHEALGACLTCAPSGKAGHASGGGGSAGSGGPRSTVGGGASSGAGTDSRGSRSGPFKRR